MRLEPLPSVLLSKERSSRLLARSYELIREHRNQEADEILDALLIAEPQNVEAWEAFMQLRRDPNDLHWLKQRVMYTPELSEADKQDILVYYNFLLRRLIQSEQSVEVKTPIPAYSPPNESITPKFNTEQNEHLQVRPQPHIESPRPRTVVFEYSDEFIQLADKFIQPVSWETPRNPKEHELIINPKYIIGLGLTALIILGLGLVADDRFFGYWILLGSLFSLVYWFLNYANPE